MGESSPSRKKIKNTTEMDEKTQPESIASFQAEKKYTGEVILLKDAIREYKIKDDNVYKINVTPTNETEKLSKIKVSQILLKNNIKNVFDIKAIGKNKLCVVFNNHTSANNFDKSEIQGIKTEIPIHYISVVGVLRGFPSDMPLSDLSSLIKFPDQILKIERITRVNPDKQKDPTNKEIPDRIPSNNVKITFHSSVLPSHIDLKYYKEKIHPYVSNTRQCTHCLRFGHSNRVCKSAKRCDKCGSNHTEDECPAMALKCVNCQGAHKASSKECQERKRQDNIKIIMSTKNISYHETMELFPQYTSQNKFSALENIDEFPALTRANYSTVLKGNPNKNKTITVNKKPFPQVPKEIREKSNRFNVYYGDLMTNTEVTRPITSNPHKTTSQEKIDGLLSQLSSVAGRPHLNGTQMEMSSLVEEIKYEINSPSYNIPNTQYTKYNTVIDPVDDMDTE